MGKDEQLWSEKLLGVHSSLRTSVVADSIVEAARALFCPDSGSLMLLDRKEGVLSVVSGFNLSDDAFSSKIRLGEGVSGRVAERKRPFLIVGKVNEYPDFLDVVPRDELRASLCLPLTSGSTVLGILNLNRERRSPKPSYGENDLRDVERLVLHATSAIKNTRSVETLIERYRVLKEADKRRSVLVAELIHEMKTPLSALRTYIDNFLSEVFGTLTEEQKTKMRRMLEQTERLASVMRQMHSGAVKELRLNRTDLASLIEGAVDAVEVLLQNSDISLKIDVPSELEVFVDSDKMEQVFVNLLTNAVKYGGEGETVVISAERVGEDVMIRVRNTGGAIPKDEVNRVFEKYYRCDVHSDTDGTGLGLMIVKEVVEMHGGSVWAEAPSGGGALFCIRLPIR